MFLVDHEAPTWSFGSSNARSRLCYHPLPFRLRCFCIIFVVYSLTGGLVSKTNRAMSPNLLDEMFQKKVLCWKGDWCRTQNHIKSY